jgi:hypothetical protein
MSRCRPWWLLCLVLVGLARGASAQAQTIEAAGGSGLAGGSGDGTFDSRYAPPFPFVEHTGLATQRLVLQRDRAALLWASLTWLPGSHVGVEGRVDYRRASVHGINGPYTISLRYVASQPPDFVPRQYSFDSSADWPETTGHVGQLTATAALVLRMGAPTRTTVRLMVGGGVTTLQGRFEPVGYSTFGLGGHSVLFADDHRLSVRFGSATAFGVAAGAELHAPMGGHAAGVVGWRLFIPRPLDLDVTVDGLAASDTGINALKLDDAQRTLAPPPVRWRPLTSDVTLGIAVRF